jgi:hypothetical protein
MGRIFSAAGEDEIYKEEERMLASVTLKEFPREVDH